MNETLLDYEGSESDIDGSLRLSMLSEMTEGTQSFGNVMSGTPSFRRNGVDMEVSMALGGITPMGRNSRAQEEEAKREVEHAYVEVGKALRKLKEANLKLGIRVPPTPVGLSTPIRRPTPIGERPAGSWRCTPGGENRPMLPMGLAGAETVQAGGVWIDLTKPPPGHATGSRAPRAAADTAVAGAAAATAATTTAGAATATTATTTTATTTTASRNGAAGGGSWRKHRNMAGNWEGGKDLREKISKRREENFERQRRKLGGRCKKCCGDHTTPECHLSPEELRCQYPPCRSKIGHATAACHELNKVCVLPVCKKAIGHRSFCHKTIPVQGGKPYGYSEEAARRLREDFNKFSHFLTEEDWEDLAVVDTSGGGAGGRGGGPVGRGGYGLSGRDRL